MTRLCNAQFHRKGWQRLFVPVRNDELERQLPINLRRLLADRRYWIEHASCEPAGIAERRQISGKHVVGQPCSAHPCASHAEALRIAPGDSFRPKAVPPLSTVCRAEARPANGRGRSGVHPTRATACWKNATKHCQKQRTKRSPGTGGPGPPLGNNNDGGRADRGRVHGTTVSSMTRR
jgi:hypothetical protein